MNNKTSADADICSSALDYSSRTSTSICWYATASLKLVGCAAEQKTDNQAKEPEN